MEWWLSPVASRVWKRGTAPPRPGRQVVWQFGRFAPPTILTAVGRGRLIPHAQRDQDEGVCRRETLPGRDQRVPVPRQGRSQPAGALEIGRPTGHSAAAARGPLPGTRLGTLLCRLTHIRRLSEKCTSCNPIVTLRLDEGRGILPGELRGECLHVDGVL